MKQLPKQLLLVSTLCLLSPHAAMAESYPAKIVSKLNNGFANVITGVGEIPKNMIITTHKKGLLLGLTSGFATGVAHTVCRTVLGGAEIATFMIPTRTPVKPAYIWKDFDRETRYFDYNMR
jgi:putative exosortase-associated protein (TIGR04073 family)